MKRSIALLVMLLIPAISMATMTDSTRWRPLFTADLSNASYPAGVWTVDAQGVMTASEDQAIWTTTQYGRYILDLEFMTADGTNSGVIVHASDRENWIPNAVEIQIADDYSDAWSKADAKWQAGAFFGHQEAFARAVRRPGEWNRLLIFVDGPIISLVMNGEPVNTIDLKRFTSARTNPDGTPIPAWLSRPWAELETRGYIGLQGKHAGAPVYFRNVRILPLD